MPHDTPLITTIVAGLVLAFVLGALANRLKMPPIVGYLIAGVCVGPHSPGFVADQTLASQLADIGVILLMFGVGLHFSLKDLLSVKAVAIPGALIRLVLASAMGMALAAFLGWPLAGGVIFGLALAVSSTVVTLKVLQDRHLMDSDRGRIAMGWLVVEDLAMVLALVLIPVFTGALSGNAGGADTGETDSFVALAEQLLHTHLGLWQVIALTVVKLLAFAGFMIVVGRRIIPAILHATAHTGSRELFRLAVLAIALGVAAGAAYLFGVSLALGAFFAGMILSESQLSQRAAQETLPLRDAFGVLFFVSVGMLFDPSIIVREPLPLLATLLIIIVGKSVVGFLLTLVLRRPVASALTVSASLAQIGEFSFILAALGITLGVLPEAGRGLILAGAIISIILNPLVFWAAERMRPRIEARVPQRTEPELGPIVPDRVEDVPPAPAMPAGEVLEESLQPTSLNNHIVLVGYGRVGGVVAAELNKSLSPFVLIEDAEGRVLAARDAGIEVIVGNAATTEVLRMANVMGARCVMIAIPNAFEAGQATEQARKLNAGVKIIARAHADEEVDYLEKLGADEVIMGEREIGIGMVDWLRGDTREQRAANDVEQQLAPAANLVREAQAARDPAATETAAGPLVEPAATSAVLPALRPATLVGEPLDRVAAGPGHAAPVAIEAAPTVSFPDLPPHLLAGERPAVASDAGAPRRIEPSFGEPAGTPPTEPVVRVIAPSNVIILPPERVSRPAPVDAVDNDAVGKGLADVDHLARDSVEAAEPAAPHPAPPQPEDPVPLPQRIEPARPAEQPAPPIPREDPAPSPQPIETPEPVEIPAPPPASTPAMPPPTRADGEARPLETETEV